MESSVKFVRLVTGEDVIAEVSYVESSKDSYYILNNPLKVVYIPNPKSGSLSITLMQWIFWKLCEDQEFILFPKDILLVKQASVGIEEYYITSLENYADSMEKLDKQDSDISYHEEDEYSDSDLIDSIIDSMKDLKRTIH
jgi:hypothetical protein